MSFQQIIIQASVKADIQTAWNCYTNPDHITQWNFASDEWWCPMATNDLRVGGSFTSRMEAKDGSFGFDFEGVYTDVVEFKHLVYLMADGRSVRVQFTESGDHTDVEVQFDAEDQNSLDMQRAGWQAILNNFKKHTESISS